jgi:predicted dehydrogenase
MASSLQKRSVASVALVGVGGHGRVHLEAIREAGAFGLGRLVAVADPFLRSHPEVSQELERDGVRCYAEDRDLLASEPDLDLLVISTPIPLHEEMLKRALASNVQRILLEKPALPTIQQLDRAIKNDVSGRVRVGFHMAFWPQVQALRDWVQSGNLGSIKRVIVTAGWPRPTSYYSRANWAGRMVIGDRSVFDGPATNGLSHLLHLVVFLLGFGGGHRTKSLQVRGNLLRARPIESYDTAWIEARIAGVGAHFLMSHAVREVTPFCIRIEGERGCAELHENAPFLRGDVAGLTRNFPKVNKSPMYARMLSSDERVFLEMPNTLCDVRAHTLISNAALISSGGVRNIPGQSVVISNPEDEQYGICGWTDLVASFCRNPVPPATHDASWGEVGGWVDAGSLTHLPLENIFQKT